ncbi:MAG: urease accessory protein UreD [Pseudomonadota bacterium]
MIPLRAGLTGTPLAPGRHVRAALGFRSGPAGTYLAHQITTHPFHITRPFHMVDDPEGMATLYLQSSSGGLYGDDELTLSIAADAGAAAQVTTQASTVVHHARSGCARMGVEITAAEGALIEYLPDPAILFAGARLDTRLSLKLAENARAILCDAVLCHDPDGANAPFEWLTTETCISGPEGPRLIDRIDVDGGDWAARTGAWPCHATLIVAGPGVTEAVTPIQQALGLRPDLWTGVSAFTDREITLARILAPDGAALTRALNLGWAAARTALTGIAPRLRQK